MLHGLVRQKTFWRGRRRRAVCFLGWWSSLASVDANTVGTGVTWHRMCDVRGVVKVFLTVLFHETHALKTCTVVPFCAYALTNNIYATEDMTWDGISPMVNQIEFMSWWLTRLWNHFGEEQQNVVAVIRYHAVMYNPKHLCRHVQKLNNIISVRNQQNVSAVVRWHSTAMYNPAQNPASLVRLCRKHGIMVQGYCPFGV